MKKSIVFMFAVMLGCVALLADSSEKSCPRNDSADACRMKKNCPGKRHFQGRAHYGWNYRNAYYGWNYGDAYQVQYYVLEFAPPRQGMNCRGKKRFDCPHRPGRFGRNCPRQFGRGQGRFGARHERPATFADFLPGIKEIFPKEFAEVQELKKKDPKAAFRKMMELKRKLWQHRKEEFKPVYEAFQAYNKSNDEAKLAEAKKLLSAKVDVAIANAKKRMEAARKELDGIKKLNICEKRFAQISRIYEKEIKFCETIANANRDQIVDKTSRLFLRSCGKRKCCPGAPQAPCGKPGKK